MAQLASFLLSTFTGFVSLLASWLGKKAAVTTALIAAYVAGIGALWASIKLLLGGIVAVLPSDPWATFLFMGFNMVLPANWEVCVSCMLSADVAVFLYRFNQNRIVGAAAQS